MNIFLWKNEHAESDVAPDVKNFSVPHSSGCHSGGAVIIAETEEDAYTMLLRIAGDYEMNGHKDIKEFCGPPVIVPLQSGVVFFGSGDC